MRRPPKAPTSETPKSNADYLFSRQKSEDNATRKGSNVVNLYLIVRQIQLH